VPTLSTRSGFTIIEVVLVLAVAGLIFLVVLVAFPALRSAQRDGQRRSDFGRIIGIFDAYALNNYGDYPDDSNLGPVDDPLGAFRINYINNQHLIDPLSDNPASPDLSYDFEDTTTHGATDATGMPYCGNPADVGTIFYKRTGRMIQLRMCLEHDKIDYTNR
jgi:prepilin-type N-terminal cleavage/methylation domain-containing protein